MHTDLELHKVIVSVTPVQETYEIGSQVTLECKAPQSYGNFTGLEFNYRWSSTANRGYIRNAYTSNGSDTYSFVVPTTHPRSAYYHCDIYRNDQFLASGNTSLTVKGEWLPCTNYTACTCTQVRDF